MSPDINQMMAEVDELEVEFKNDMVWDLVTIYDRKIEEVLIKKIKERYPQHKWVLHSLL